MVRAARISREVDAVEPGDQVGEADEVAEQAALVDALAEAADALAPDQVAAFPVLATGIVQMRT
jgi:hypothetical protein